MDKAGINAMFVFAIGVTILGSVILVLVGYKYKKHKNLGNKEEYSYGI